MSRRPALSAAVAARVVGLQNIRDLGGLPVDGGQIRHGVLLRSDAPRHGDPAPKVAAWPPGTVIDLRSGGEGEAEHPLLAEGAAVHTTSLSSAASLGHLAEADGALPTLTEIYQQTITEAGPRFARLAAVVAGSDRSVLVHCTAGKDRTGMLIAVLLRAVGVSRDAIIADYERTAACMPGVVARIRSNPALAEHATAIDVLLETHPELLSTSREAIEAVLDPLDLHDGGAAGWVMSHGLDRVALRRLATRLLQRHPMSSSARPVRSV